MEICPYATANQKSLNLTDERTHSYDTVNSFMYMVNHDPSSHIITPLLDEIRNLQHWNFLLQRVVEATQLLLSGSDFNAALSQTLQILGKATEVDRIYLFENIICSETEVLASTPMSYWVRGGGNMTLNHLPWRSSSAFAETHWYRTLATRKVVHIWTAGCSTEDRQRLAAVGVCSMLLLPVHVNEQFWGYLALENLQHNRVWNTDEEALFLTMATAIGSALSHQRKASQLEQNAFYDPLTHLPNRALFINRLEQFCRQAKRNQKNLFAVLFIDLDRFKVINDSLGHAVGDQLLVSIAQRLAANVRPGDTVARLGGDEFVVLLNPIQSVDDATLIADRFRDALNQTFHIGKHELSVEMSIGIVLSTQRYENAAELMQQADRAMYRAKSAGKNCYELFDATADAEGIALAQLETEMGLAIQRQAFEVYYQPIIHLPTGRLDGFEALLRWHHRRWGWVKPDTFIPLAEKTGMIDTLGEFVLNQASAQLHQWQSLQPEWQPLTLSVNLSIHQLRKSDLPAKIACIVEREQLKPSDLKLELTESIAIEQDKIVLANLNQLTEMGFQLHLDDFGIGYSSLSCLHHLPIRAIKVDRSFIQRIDIGQEGLAIMQTIVNMANVLELDIIAEGIETQSQLDALLLLRCPSGQGYWYSPPVSYHQAEHFLRRHAQSSNLSS